MCFWGSVIVVRICVFLHIFVYLFWRVYSSLQFLFTLSFSWFVFIFSICQLTPFSVIWIAVFSVTLACLFTFFMVSFDDNWDPRNGGGERWLLSEGVQQRKKCICGRGVWGGCNVVLSFMVEVFCMFCLKTSVLTHTKIMKIFFVTFRKFYHFAFHN